MQIAFLDWACSTWKCDEFLMRICETWYGGTLIRIIHTRHTAYCTRAAVSTCKEKGNFTGGYRRTSALKWPDRPATVSMTTCIFEHRFGVDNTLKTAPLHSFCPSVWYCLKPCANRCAIHLVSLQTTGVSLYLSFSFIFPSRADKSNARRANANPRGRSQFCIAENAT